MTKRTLHRGFTLVELLVVISIIGILLGLAGGAAMIARRHVMAARIALEINQLDGALHAYSQKYGEFPPDFCGTTLSVDAQNMVIRHLARAFPRYIPGYAPNNSGSTPWQMFCYDLAYFTSYNPQTGQYTGVSNGMQINYLDPASALVFWLGGPAYFTPDLSSKKVYGFSSNPLNPFEPPYDLSGGANMLPNMTSRQPTFFQFDESRLQPYSSSVTATPTTGWALCYYPQGVQPRSTTPVIYPPYLYFRAEANYYFLPGSQANQTPLSKFWPCANSGFNNAAALVEPNGLQTGTTLSSIYVRPYFNFDPNKQQTLLSGSYFNKDTFQIISAGLDGAYGGSTVDMNNAGLNTNALQAAPRLPSGDNLLGLHNDNVTNFTSNGTINSTFLHP